jgi:putative oxidoreductase
VNSTWASDLSRFGLGGPGFSVGVKLPALNSLEKLRDHGLFLFRALVGGTFVFFGTAQLAAGAAAWQGIGGELHLPAVGAAPTLIGLAVVLVVVIGGALLVLGAWTRWAALALGLAMLVAAAVRFPAVKSGTLEGAADFFYPASIATALWVVATVGGGRFGIDAVYRARQKRKKRRGGA